MIDLTLADVKFGLDEGALNTFGVVEVAAEYTLPFRPDIIEAIILQS
jgi:hypothetical protein